MANEYTLIANAQSSTANAIEILFTASSDTQITAFTATNNTGVNRSYRVYIYDSSNGTEANSPTKFVTSLRGFDLAPAIIGHIVPKGGTIRVESSAAGSLIFRATGQIVST